MDIVIGNLIGLGVIAFLFWKYVRPPLSKAVNAQKATIAQYATDSEAASAKLTDAQQAHASAIERSRIEAQELHQGALGDAESIKSDLAAKTESEIRRIAEQGKAQEALVRSNVVRKLRGKLGNSAVESAAQIVREHLSDPTARSESIDRAITDLESMSARNETSPTPTNADLVGLHSMRAASREAAVAVSKAFSAASDGATADQLNASAEEIAQVVELLEREHVLRKRLSEVADDDSHKLKLARDLFEGRVSPLTFTAIETAVKGRWSSTADFMQGLRRQAGLAVLAAAEKDGTVEQVEDELFRTSRLLEANPDLTALLSDHTGAPSDKRVALLKSLVGSQVNEHTWYLLSHALRLLHGQPADVAIDSLAELAAARRGESVAHVVTPAELTDAQSSRLAAVLGSIYGRTISVQTEIDPELLGGLRIAVGDEVVEADIASRLAKAAEALPN